MFQEQTGLDEPVWLEQIDPVELVNLMTYSDGEIAVLSDEDAVDLLRRAFALCWERSKYHYETAAEERLAGDRIRNEIRVISTAVHPS